MTRINCGVPPKNLTRQHLLAEHREIKRVPNRIKSGRFNMKDQPSRFTLGTGHEKFFYDKLLYLKNRYVLIHRECISRGYNVQDYSSAWDGIPKVFMNDYSPTSNDRAIVEQRIQERLSK